MSGEKPLESEHHDQQQENGIDAVVVEGDILSSEPDGTESAADQARVDQRIAQLEAQASEYKDQWLRAVADFKNYKRRAEAERDELKRSANAGLLLKLFPVLDDIERAIDNVPPEIVGISWWSGITMIAQKFRVLIESEGVSAILSVGEDFDPNLHHAVTYEEAAGQEGKVIEELQKGYKLRDRVLRPSMVKVGRE